MGVYPYENWKCPFIGVFGHMLSWKSGYSFSLIGSFVIRDQR